VIEQVRPTFDTLQTLAAFATDVFAENLHKKTRHDKSLKLSLNQFKLFLDLSCFTSSFRS